MISIQYHSEASPGPLDNIYVFDRFLEMIKEFAPAKRGGRLMSEVEYRQATEKDAAAIATVGAAVWDEIGANSGLPQRPTKDGVAGLLLPPTATRERCSSATTPARVSGFAALSPDPDDADQAVMGVWLLRSARRKGVGRELALMATDFARAAGWTRSYAAPSRKATSPRSRSAATSARWRRWWGRAWSTSCHCDRLALSHAVRAANSKDRLQGTGEHLGYPEGRVGDQADPQTRFKIWPD